MPRTRPSTRTSLSAALMLTLSAVVAVTTNRPATSAASQKPAAEKAKPVAPPAPPAPADPVSEALGREIIGPRQTLAETSDRADATTPRTPALKTQAEWEAFAAKARAEVFSKVLFRGPAASWRDAEARVEWLETINGGTGYHIKKLRYEVVPGLWAPALLYEPDDLKARGKAPVVLNVNGHDAKGKAADYKQARCVNLARRGMLALNIEWFGMGQLRTEDDRHDQINQIDLCGASGVSLHYLAMTRAIDLLLALEQADPTRVAVTGLSGGGWQTIFLSAFETRVTLANPVAGYSSFLTRSRKFSDLGDSEQTPNDLATVTDYAVMTAMMAPRPLLLTFNEKDDCCFAAGHALPPLIEAAAPVYALFGKGENLRSHVNHDPGTHNYLVDNRQAFYRMVGDHFFPGDPKFDAKEVPADKDVKTPDQLHVALPADNASLHALAVGLSRSLPRDAALPNEAKAASAWRDDRRAKLREIVRAKNNEVQVVSSRSASKDGLKATSWRLKVGDWSVPVVELVRDGAESKGTTLLVADKGRKDPDSAAAARELLNSGRRVLAVDPFYVGEAKIGERDYLFALLLAAVGDRPLGVQAGEIAAVARWARGERKLGAVSIQAVGPRTSVMALVAAGLEPDAIAGLELRQSYGSLKELIETNTTYPTAPELFCFGLLETFDVAQLAALAAPRPVTFPAASPRARIELGALKAWYTTWGVDHEPIR